HRHALEQYKKVKYGSCTAGGLGQQIAANEAGTAGAILMSPDLFGKLIDQAVDGIVRVGYAKTDEFEADKEGPAPRIRTGYDPKPFIGFLNSLEGGGGVFDNHPPGRERAARLLTELDRLKDEQPFLATFDTPKIVPLRNELAAVK